MPEVTSLEPKDLFAVLDARRRELGLSQVELCTRAFGEGAATDTWQNLRRGASINQTRLLALLHALGIRLSLDPIEDFDPAEQKSDLQSHQPDRPDLVVTDKYGNRTEFDVKNHQFPEAEFLQSFDRFRKSRYTPVSLVSLDGSDDATDETGSDPNAAYNALKPRSEFESQLVKISANHWQVKTTLRRAPQKRDRTIKEQLAEFVPVAWVDKQQDAEPIQFRRSWFMEAGIDPKSCRLLVAPDTTVMMPTIPPNSLVMIDVQAPVEGARLAAFETGMLNVGLLSDRRRNKAATTRTSNVTIARMLPTDNHWILSYDAVGRIPELYDLEAARMAYLGQVIWVGSRLY